MMMSAWQGSSGAQLGQSKFIPDRVLVVARVLAIDGDKVAPNFGEAVITGTARSEGEEIGPSRAGQRPGTVAKFPAYVNCTNREGP